MRNSEIKTMSDVELNAYKESTLNRMNAITEASIAQLNTLIKQYLPEWFVIHLNADNMEIGFNTSEKWGNTGKPIAQELHIYFGEDRWKENKFFKFEVNTCCFGSFEVESTGREATYYKGVGELLSNVPFRTAFKEEISKFYYEYRILDNLIWDINYEVRDREEEAKEKVLKEKQIQELTTIPSSLANNTYALVHKSGFDYPNVIYRKQSMKAEAFGSYSEMNQKLWEKGRWENYYKIIETSRLKVAVA